MLTNVLFGAQVPVNAAVTFEMPAHGVEVVALWANELGGGQYNILHQITVHHFSGNLPVTISGIPATSTFNVLRGDMSFVDSTSGTRPTAIPFAGTGNALFSDWVIMSGITNMGNTTGSAPDGFAPVPNFVMPGNNVNLRVNWSNTTRVEIVDTGANTFYINTQGTTVVNVLPGTTVLLVAGSRTGYVFNGWEFHSVPNPTDDTTRIMPTHTGGFRSNLTVVDVDVVYAVAAWRPFDSGNGDNGNDNGDNGNGDNGTPGNGGNVGNGNGTPGNGAPGNGGNGNNDSEWPPEGWAPPASGSGNGGNGNNDSEWPPEGWGGNGDNGINGNETIMPAQYGPEGPSIPPSDTSVNQVTLLPQGESTPHDVSNAGNLLSTSDDGYIDNHYVAGPFGAAGAPPANVQGVIWQDVNNPQTGDGQSFAGLIASSAALILSSAALIIIVLVRKRNEKLAVK
jgi:hypothetical protein